MDPYTQISSHLTPNQRKLKEKFDSATSVEELIETFNDSEKCLDDEKDLGLACWFVARKLHEKEDSVKVLCFASRALKILKNVDSSNKGFSSQLSLPIIENLQLLGSACGELKMFEDSLGYLNLAAGALGKLEGDTSYTDNIVLLTSHAVEVELFNVKSNIGQLEEGISHLIKAVEITEQVSGKTSKELAQANRQVADAYFALRNFREAMRFYLKSMGIYMTMYGDSSEEVAESRKYLGTIYFALQRFEKGLEQNMLAQRVLKKLGSTSLLHSAEIDASAMLYELGRYEESLDILRDLVPRTEKLSQDQMMVFSNMAESLCSLEKFAEAKKFAGKACAIPEQHDELNPCIVAMYFQKIAAVYEKMKDYETALSLLMRVRAILENLPPDIVLNPQFLDLHLRIGSLLRLKGNAEQAIPYLEQGIDIIEKCCPSKHSRVGLAYATLGSVYFDVNKLQLSALVFGYAKDILDESLGPHHKDSIMACKSICRAYTFMRSFSVAVSYMEEVVKRLKVVGPPDELAEALKMVAALKKNSNNDGISISNEADFVIPEKNALGMNSVEKDKDKRGDISKSLQGLKISGKINK